MGENVKVVVRCRPMNQRERDSKCEDIVDIGDYVVSVLNPLDRNAPKKCFTFDSVYDALSKTEIIYNDLCYPLVESTLEGYNGTIFAYGQTGCGKTHTMQGEDRYGSGAENGIIPRCFDHIFERISMANGVRYLALVSYLEIYNENIRDLLSTHELASSNHALKDVPGVGVTVPSLTTHTVVSAKECYNWLNIGNKNRITAATLMNEKSSRSHTIFTINLEQIQGGTSPAATTMATEELIGGIRRGKLNLVDLAGSERQRKTGALGDRLKEATKINLSLSALGNVISSLVDGKTKHVPYRDSKLTRLLQDSLGGNTKTLMISCISPADVNYDETLSTLRYACRAKNISNIPKINEDPKDAKLRQYQDEILKLKKLLDESQQLEHTMLHRQTENDESRKTWIAEQRAKLREEMQQELSQLQQTQQLPQSVVTAVLPSSTIVEAVAAPTIDPEELQLQAKKRIDLIKHALIGGERVNDVQLRERHRKRKIEAQRRLSAIAHAISRVEQSEDRHLLQGHYASIQQEINVKNEYIRMCVQKIKMLEREVCDLQSEFQLDREDYLDEIRDLGRNIKFYQQLLSKALPILRKNGKQWNPESILENSAWNDDLKAWKLPETIINPFKLPPANLSASFHSTPTLLTELDKNAEQQAEAPTRNTHSKSDDDKDSTEDSSETYKVNVLKNYFRPNRQKPRDYGQRTRSSQAWKGDIILRNRNALPINGLKSAHPHKKPTFDYDFSRMNNPLGKSWSSAVMDKLMLQFPHKTEATTLDQPATDSEDNNYKVVNLKQLLPTPILAIQKRPVDLLNDIKLQPKTDD